MKTNTDLGIKCIIVNFDMGKLRVFGHFNYLKPSTVCISISQYNLYIPLNKAPTGVDVMGLFKYIFMHEL